jgi:CheY-like chemotaxis protein
MKKKELGKKGILIVDEGSETLKFLKEETRRIGLNYHFEKAATFLQAVDSISSGKYDLVILDFPGIRGPYLLNLAFLREIPVVLLVTSDFIPLEAHHLLEKVKGGLLPRENLSGILPLIENLLSRRKASNPPDISKDVI